MSNSALARHPDYVAPARTATLLALLDVVAADGRATVRKVARRRDVTVGTAHWHLVRLRTEHDLVAWTEGQMGTLRPLVATVPLLAGQPVQSGAAGPPGGT